MKVTLWENKEAGQPSVLLLIARPEEVLVWLLLGGDGPEGLSQSLEMIQERLREAMEAGQDDA